MRIHDSQLPGLSACLLAALLSAGVASAGTVDDGDGDLVPSGFDNCLFVPNGPNEGSNQIDTDRDGYGNACDADCDQDGVVTAADFGFFIAVFGSIFPNPVDACHDADGDGTISAADFGVFLSQFGGPVGASGLACADPTIMPGEMPCVP